MIRGSVRALRAVDYARNTLVHRFTLGVVHQRLVALYGAELEVKWQARGLSLLEDALEELAPGALERLVSAYLEDGDPPSREEHVVEVAYWHAEAELAAELGLAPPLSSRVLAENGQRWAELLVHVMEGKAA